MFKSRCQISGITLIELMLAMMISLFILSVLSFTYVTTMKNHQKQTALNNIQENGRMALQLLQTAVQSADHLMGLDHAVILYQFNPESNRLEEIRYFTQETTRKSERGRPVFALYMKNTQKNKIELVEGIDEMQIQYDVDEEGEIVSLPADQIKDWSQVLALEIKISLSSTIGSCLQKTWYSTIALRNG